VGVYKPGGWETTGEKVRGEMGVGKPVPSINSSAWKNVRVLDTASVDEFFDHTGITSQWNVTGPPST